jgi:hypothetical protein
MEEQYCAREKSLAGSGVPDDLLRIIKIFSWNLSFLFAIVEVLLYNNLKTSINEG